MEPTDKMYHVAYVAKNQDGSRAVDSAKREITGWASKPIIDRDHELIEWDAWELKNFKKNPVMMAGHDYSKNPIARVIWIKATEEGLMFKAKFPTEGKSLTADEIFNLYEEEIMNAFSVGFQPLKWEDAEDDKEPRRRHTKAELFEISAVGLPSCTEALMAAYRDGNLKTKGLKEAVQNVIDATPIGKTQTYDRALSAEEIDELYKTQSLPPDDDVETNKEAIVTPAGEVTGGWEKEEHPERDPLEAMRQEGIEKAEDGFVPVSKGMWNALCNSLKTKVTDNATYLQKVYGGIEAPAGVWNKALSDAFDIPVLEEITSSFRYSLFASFLECEIKDIYLNSYEIPSPLLGTYLESISIVTHDLTIHDIRRFTSDGKESPPQTEYIQLNSKTSKKFLIHGTQFATKKDMKILVDFSPSWYGLDVIVVTSAVHEEQNDEIMSQIHREAANNHMLKGEKFALSGEFLESTGDKWSDLILADEDVGIVRKSLTAIESSSPAVSNRGLLFVGPPGTGKTLTGRTIMSNTKHTFIWVSAKDFHYSSGSGIISLAFRMARKLFPSVLFFEDIDSWLGGSAIDTLKIELDGLKQNKGLMTVLTTNFPESLPAALIDRPGRFHHILHFALPDAKQRGRMLTLWAEEASAETIKKIAESTTGFSGAHIRELVQYARFIAEDDGTDLDSALLISMEKLQEQRELISMLQEPSKPASKQSEMIEMTDEDFEALVSAKLDEKRQSEEFQTLSDSVAGLKKELAKARVQQGGIA